MGVYETPKGVDAPCPRGRTPTAGSTVDRSLPTPWQASQRVALQPRRAAAVERVECGAGRAGHVGLHLEAVLGLQIGEVTVPLGKFRQQLGVEFWRLQRVDRIEAILLVDRLAQYQTPATVALLEEIVEAADTGEVAHDPVHRRAVQDLHPGLRHGPRTRHVDPRDAKTVLGAHAAGKALAAGRDEIVRAALAPR